MPYKHPKFLGVKRKEENKVDKIRKDKFK